MAVGLMLLSVAIMLYAAVALRLGRWSISMPMVFVLVGYWLGPGGANLIPISLHTEVVEPLAEITLALVLFGDASTLNLRQVREDWRLPLRLLTVGLLLAIVLGTVLGWLLLPAEGLILVALFAAILAPTDAALGLPIFTLPSIPVRIRRALNVESGLNDGIATPFVTLFLAFATVTDLHTGTESGWLGVALVEIALAVLIGTTVGVSGSWVLLQASRHHWTSEGSEQLAILGVALTAYLGAVAIHGNGFIAAFVGGLAFGRATGGRFAAPTEFTETFSSFLMVLVWVIFGALLVPMALHYTSDWRPIVYAILSLTVVRMVSVALALMGTKLRLETVALMGWFGPRGLASVVFTLLAFDQLEAVGQPIDTLVAVATWTILLSVLLHGLSAQPLSRWYAHRLAAVGDKSTELVEFSELRKRHHVFTGRPGNTDESRG